MTLLSFNAVAIAEEFPLVTLVTENLPPLQYRNQNQELDGYSFDLITAAMAKSKLPYKLDVYPWARSYNLTKNKQDVCIFSIARIPERETMFHWVARLAETNTVIYGLRKSRLNIKTLDDAKNYNVAVIRDDATHLLLLKYGFEEKKNLYIVNNTESLLKLVYTKPEIDLIVADDVTIRYRAKNAGIAMSEFESLVVIENTSLNFHLACNLSTQSIILERLKHGFSAIKKDGTLEQINNKWHDDVGDAYVQ